MPGAIPQHFIDDLLTRADIVEVIGRRIPLKKAGREFQACCPFHSEKTPSFTVSPTKQFYHCFGCGAHGSALGFLMEYDRLSFPEAVEELASSMGLEVPHEAGFEQGPDNRPLYDILERAAKYYALQLRQHADAPRAIDYLRGRGVSGEIAADFRLGFAPPGWDNLLQALGTDERHIRLLREAGLISEQDGKRYDRLRDRIIFPIRDTRGRVVGFGGRVLGDGKPKYLNSPETPVFHKGRELYGLYEARQAVIRNACWSSRATWTSSPWPSSASAMPSPPWAPPPPPITWKNCTARRPRWCSASTATAPAGMPPGRRCTRRCR